MKKSVRDGQLTATCLFYNTTELLESVLMYLPVECIVPAILADKRMHHIILHSPRLRHRLRLEDDTASLEYSDHACVLVQEILSQQDGLIALRQRWDLPCIQHYIFKHPNIAHVMRWPMCPSRRHLEGLLHDTLQRLPVQIALRVPFHSNEDNQQPAALFRKIIHDAQRLSTGLDDRLNLDFLSKGPQTLGESTDSPLDSEIDEESSAERVWPRLMPSAGMELHPNFHDIFDMTRWLCVPIIGPDHIDWIGCQLPGPPPSTSRPLLKLFVVLDAKRKDDWPQLEDYAGELWTQMNVTMPPRDVIVYPAIADQLGAEPFMIPHTRATMGYLLEAIEARIRLSYDWFKLGLREKNHVAYQVNHLYRQKCAIMRNEFVHARVTQMKSSERKGSQQPATSVK